ncbi:MAG: hypothetical protein HQM08_22425 [Candidatus Riflebacteria bacterium]|nr:hypothetical protein [Candidatus Riflebacteria bacterium]
MYFFKYLLPPLITFVTGLFLIISFFLDESFSEVKRIELMTQKWIVIVAIFALILGVANLLKANLKKISEKKDGWGYNLVLVISFCITAVIGFLSGLSDKPPAIGDVRWNQDIKGYVRIITTTPCTNATEPPVFGFEVCDETMKDLPVKKEATAEKLKTSFKKTFENLNDFIFQGILKPAGATMISLLAFFIASAAFRAFRIKSIEASILFISAIVVMIGNVPLGNTISGGLLPRLKDWILEVPGSGAQTAIIIGAAAGYIVAALKLIFGVERTHLGGEN